MQAWQTGRRSIRTLVLTVAVKAGINRLYPFLKAFWCPELNPIPLSQISVASEKFGIFELPDGRIVPARISNLSAWLHYHSAAGVEQYFDRLFKIDMERFS